MQSRVERSRAERKLSLLALGVAWLGVETGSELHWSCGKKLRHINMECRIKRVRLPLPCEIFIGDGTSSKRRTDRGSTVLTFFRFSDHGTHQRVQPEFRNLLPRYATQLASRVSYGDIKSAFLGVLAENFREYRELSHSEQNVTSKG